jgi:uncharacterized protein involved in exopolysaccharide biosynthesis
MVTDLAQSQQAGSSDEVSVVGLMNSLLRQRRLIIGVMGTVVFAVMVWTFARPRTYTAAASFLPQSSESRVSGLAGVAAQFGVAIPMDQSGQSPQFYADLIRSRRVLAALVDTTYGVRDAGVAREATLADVLGIRERSARVRRELTMLALSARIIVLVDVETNVVTVQVATTDAELSLQLVQNLLRLVSAFNLESRQTQGRAERRFVESTVEQARGELRASEDRLQEFLQRNREFRNSPELLFGYDRLQRDVALRQQVAVSLAQSYEQARIAEVRNTPVVTVVEQPEAPVIPDRRRLLLKGLLALLGGGVLGAFLALGRDLFIRSSSSEPDEYTEFVALRRAASRDLVRASSVTTRPLRAAWHWLAARRGPRSKE